MVKVRKNQDFHDVVSFLSSNEQPRKACRRPRAREDRAESVYYVLRPTSSVRPLVTPRASWIWHETSRRPRSSMSSRRTLMKPAKRPRRNVGMTCATAQRERTGGSSVGATGVERRSNAVSQRSSVDDPGFRYFLNAVDSLELIRERFRARTRAGSTSHPPPADPEYEDGDEDKNGENASTLTQIFSQFIGGFWAAPTIG